MQSPNTDAVSVQPPDMSKFNVVHSALPNTVAVQPGSSYIGIYLNCFFIILISISAKAFFLIEKCIHNHFYFIRFSGGVQSAEYASESILPNDTSKHRNCPTWT